MSEVAIRNAQSSRTRQLVWPREHGAWGILFIPLVTGAAIGLQHGSHTTPLALFALVAFALFCLRTPVESLLGTTPMRAQTADERRHVWLVVAAFSVVAVAALAALLAGGDNLVLVALGTAAGVLFVVQGLVRKLGRSGRMPAQLIGALGLTSTAAGAYYVASGQFDQRALALWLANWVFAGNQVHFVQLRIHAARLTTWTEKFARGRSFFAGQIAMLLVLAAGYGFHWLPGWALPAFLPVFVRGMMWFFRGPQPLDVHRLGFTELAHALAFGVLLVIGFSL